MKEDRGRDKMEPGRKGGGVILFGGPGKGNV